MIFPLCVVITSLSPSRVSFTVLRVGAQDILTTHPPAICLTLSCKRYAVSRGHIPLCLRLGPDLSSFLQCQRSAVIRCLGPSATIKRFGLGLRPASATPYHTQPIYRTGLIAHRGLPQLSTNLSFRNWTVREVIRIII